MEDGISVQGDLVNSPRAAVFKPSFIGNSLVRIVSSQANWRTSIYSICVLLIADNSQPGIRTLAKDNSWAK
jgi:hypothetical protein